MTDRWFHLLGMALGYRLRLMCLLTAVVLGGLAASPQTPSLLAAAFQTSPIDRPIPWSGSSDQAVSPAISPDGRLLSYASAGPVWDLHTRDLETGGDRRLTRIGRDGGLVDQSAISHDGQWVTFAASDKNGAGTGLRVLPVAASPADTPRRILEVTDGSWVIPHGWSSDDKLILVTIGGKRIGLLTVSTGALEELATIEPLAPGSRVRLSPDGMFVAYDRAASETIMQRDLFLLPVTGGPAVRVLPDPSSDSVADWTPDGRNLLFLRESDQQNGLWALPVEKGRAAGPPVLLHAGFVGSPLGVTAQGALFYDAPPPGPSKTLLTADFDPATGKLSLPVPLACADEHIRTRFPRWSADGTELMWISGSTDHPRLSICRAGETVPTTIPLNLPFVWTFDWSADRSTLVFRADDLLGRKGIFTVARQTGTVEMVAPFRGRSGGAFHPAFTPDGKALRYFRCLPRDGGRHCTYVQRTLLDANETVVLDGERLDELGKGTCDTSPPSPNGRYYLSTTCQAPPSILRAFDAETSRTWELLRVEGSREAFNHNGDLRWTPDSRAVITTVRTADGPTELWWIPVDGREPHRLELQGFRPTTDALAIRPDGRQIAFVVNPRPAEAFSQFRLLEKFLPGTSSRPPDSGRR